MLSEVLELNLNWESLRSRFRLGSPFLSPRPKDPSPPRARRPQRPRWRGLYPAVWWQHSVEEVRVEIRQTAEEERPEAEAGTGPGTGPEAGGAAKASIGGFVAAATANGHGSRHRRRA